MLKCKVYINDFLSKLGLDNINLYKCVVTLFFVDNNKLKIIYLLILIKDFIQ